MSDNRLLAGDAPAMRTRSEHSGLFIGTFMCVFGLAQTVWVGAIGYFLWNFFTS
jgi:nitrate reductase NapE component